MPDSKVAELARAEAERAEADEDEQEQPDGGESDAVPEEPEPEPEQPPTPPPATEADAVGPEQIAKAEKAVAAQRKKLAGILSEAFVAHECPMCSALGFVPELPQPGTTLQFESSGDQLVLSLIGPANPGAYESAHDKGECPACKGLGQVRTGSRHPNFMIAPCGRCAGAGWVQVAAPSASPNAASWTDQAQPGGAGNGANVEIADAWGRPAGHPFWGVPPADVPLPS